MACNLATSITLAAITSERLRALVTPEVAQEVLRAVLADQRLTGEVTIYGDAAYWYGYTDSIAIEGGTVRVTSGTYQRRDALATATEAALKQVAGSLLSAKLAAALQRTTRNRPAVRQVQAEENGTVKRYTLLTAKF